MKKYKCLIVEDEPLASELVTEYISTISSLELTAVCRGVRDAINVVRKDHVDLIFLDIELPEWTGFDLLKSLKEPPSVIIISAYHEYALESYNYNVVDYLLKPVDYPRFVNAVNKFLRSVFSVGVKDDQYCYISVNRKNVRLIYADILYLESRREYVKIHMENQFYLPKTSMANLEKKLAPSGFTRIHKSFMVNPKKITGFSATNVEIGGTQLPLSRNYKKSFNEAMNLLRLNIR